MQADACRLYIRAQMYIPPTRADSRPYCAPNGGRGVWKILVDVGARTLSRARHLCCRGASLLFVCTCSVPVSSFPFVRYGLAAFAPSLGCTVCGKKMSEQNPYQTVSPQSCNSPSMWIMNIMSKCQLQPGAGASPQAPEAPRLGPQPLRPY